MAEERRLSDFACACFAGWKRVCCERTRVAKCEGITRDSETSVGNGACAFSRDGPISKFEAPPWRSVGQARAFGQTVDPAIVKGLKALFELRRKPDPSTPPDKIEEQLGVATKAFLGTLKDKTGLDLAKAIVEATAGERLDPKMVSLLDAVVRDSKLPLDVVELRMLRQLAARAKVVGDRDWDDETARIIWDTVVLAEEANNRHLTFSWVNSLLDDADAQRAREKCSFCPKPLASHLRLRSKTHGSECKPHMILSIAVSREFATLGESSTERGLPWRTMFLTWKQVAGRSTRVLWLQTARSAIDLDRLSLPGPESRNVGIGA